MDGGDEEGLERARTAHVAVISRGAPLRPVELLAAAARAGRELPAHASTAWPLLLGAVAVEACEPSELSREGRDELPQALSDALAGADAAYRLHFAPGLDGVLDALSLAALLLEPAGGALHDPSQARWLDAETLTELLRADELDLREHVELHAVPVGDGAAAWVHTHGLAKFGVPELEAHGVPADVVEDVSELFHELGGAMVFGDGPSLDETLELPGGEVRLVDAALPRAETRLPAVELRRHDGPRWAIVPVDERSLADAVRGYATVEVRSDEELETERASAQAMLEAFVARAGRRTSGEAFFVKAPFPVRGPQGDTEEHIWVELEAVRPGVIEGPLATSSFFEPARWSEGTRVEVLLAEVEALAATRDGEMIPDDELASFLGAGARA